MHWKKHLISLVFWLLFPLIATIIVTTLIDTLQDDAKVPVGIVLEEESDATSALVKELKASSFIQTNILSEKEALHSLKKHKLDSVFVIHDNFEHSIEQDNRNRLITAYQSDLSFAYTPVKEKIISYVQQETGRSKAAYTVKELEQKYNVQEGWTITEIKAQSKAIQQEENLLNTDLTFKGKLASVNDNMLLFSIWGLWGILSFLSTLLLFDWVIKEKQSKVIERMAYTRWSLKSYLLQNFILYTVLLLIIDLATATAFHFLFGERISLINLFTYRVLISMAAFLLAGIFKQSFYYFTLAFVLTLIVSVGSGPLLLSTGVLKSGMFFDLINPLGPLLTGDYFSIWSILVITLFVVWFFRKEHYYA